MRLHIVLIRTLSGDIQPAYIGPDRAAALSVYDSQGSPGDRLELYSFPMVTRWRVVPPADAPIMPDPAPTGAKKK